ncbi:MAG: LD-carboxypeptidase [Thermodesulfobacteriota bacterium]
MSETAKQIIIPPRLQPGDTIGLVTPAGPIRDRDTVRAGIDILEKAGFQVKLPVDLEKEEYLAGSDEARARQLTEVWHDPEVQGILAIRGGYGAMRLLPYLDPAGFAETPKILAGFSDITILLNEIQRWTGLVTYHTPVLTTLAQSDAASQQSFLEMLTGPARTITPPDLQILTGSNATGHLIGGNLASLSHLLGTPYEPVWRNGILFIEDVGEAPYQIDRMLTQLQASGRLGQLSGLILGTFSEGDEHEKKWSELIWTRAQELTGGQIPLWGNFPVGHGARNLTMPIGMTAAMDSTNGRLDFTS